MTAEATAVLEVDGLRRGFGSGDARVEALRGVSFEIRPGELVVLRGRSGSGKTTLLNLVGGLDRPDAGRVSVAGHRLDDISAAELLRLRRERMAFVFQSFGLIPILTAAENVGVPLRLLRTLVHAEGVTALVATHDRALMDVADRVLTISDGQLV